MNAALEARARKEPTRPYLGASGLGHECDRQGWLGFHWANQRVLTAAGIKAIEDGHRGEDLMAERLSLVQGVTIYRFDENGKQFGFRDLGGHLAGNCDGVIVGLLQAPVTPHVWEHKVCNEKKFIELHKAKQTVGEKGALKKWDAIYYAQAQLYMHYLDLTRHYLTVTTPGNRAEMSCRTDYDFEFAARTISRAKRMIFDRRPLSRVSENPGWYLCQWCQHRGNCHDNTLPAVNCRTCIHSTPMEDGQWHCARFGKTLTLDEQRSGCGAHLFHPDLVPGKQIDSGPDWVSYQLKDGTIYRDGEKA